MGKYKVKVIQMALKNNKLANSGELVSESQLTGNAEDLVNRGFLEKVSGKEKKDSKKAAAKEAEEKAAAKEAEEKAAAKEAEEKAAAKEAEEKAAFDEAYENGTLNEVQLESVTIAAIKEYASKHDRTFNDKALKPELIKEVLNA